MALGIGHASVVITLRVANESDEDVRILCDRAGTRHVAEHFRSIVHEKERDEGATNASGATDKAVAQTGSAYAHLAESDDKQVAVFTDDRAVTSHEQNHVDQEKTAVMRSRTFGASGGAAMGRSAQSSAMTNSEKAAADGHQESHKHEASNAAEQRSSYAQHSADAHNHAHSGEVSGGGWGVSAAVKGSTSGGASHSQGTARDQGSHISSTNSRADAWSTFGSVATKALDLASNAVNQQKEGKVAATMGSSNTRASDRMRLDAARDLSDMRNTQQRADRIAQAHKSDRGGSASEATRFSAQQHEGQSIVKEQAKITDTEQRIKLDAEQQERYFKCQLQRGEEWELRIDTRMGCTIFLGSSEHSTVEKDVSGRAADTYVIVAENGTHMYSSLPQYMLGRKVAALRRRSLPSATAVDAMHGVMEIVATCARGAPSIDWQLLEMYRHGMDAFLHHAPDLYAKEASLRHASCWARLRGAFETMTATVSTAVCKSFMECSTLFLHHEATKDNAPLRTLLQSTFSLKPRVGIMEEFRVRVVELRTAASVSEMDILDERLASQRVAAVQAAVEGLLQPELVEVLSSMRNQAFIKRPFADLKTFFSLLQKHRPDDYDDLHMLLVCSVLPRIQESSLQDIEVLMDFADRD